MKAIINIFWNLLIGKGLKKSSQKTFNKRMKICKSNKCGAYQKPLNIKALERCGDCGCFLNLKARVDEFYIKCPQGLW
tara:strand:+ start:3487 stop:3720 length:234 start_codon:yes stop_codon:yes gene_type:complete